MKRPPEYLTPAGRRQAEPVQGAAVLPLPRVLLAAGLAAASLACGPAQLPHRLAASEAISLPAPVPVATPNVVSEAFGSTGDRGVERYTLRNAHGLTLQVITYGAIITALRLPDRDGSLADVVLGYDDLEGYLGQRAYFGAIVGRVANRIRGAAFELDGQRHVLAANDGRDHLHGGRVGWDRVVWTASSSSDVDGASVRLEYVSSDGEEGYPGTVNAVVTYTLTNADELWVDMRARTDRTTLVNMAQHGYFNLAGAAAGSVAGHTLELYADEYTPGDPLIPDGRVLPVAGTRLDFREPAPLGPAMSADPASPSGFDHNFIVRGEPHVLRPVARLEDPRSGRVLELDADQPGVQLYTANHLRGAVAGKGVSYVRHAGVCLETQAFPNAINTPAWRGDVILTPDREYRHRMRYRFSTLPHAEPGAVGASDTRRTPS
jgi:aldose 1-epimerase